MKLPKIIAYYTDGRKNWYLTCAKELEDQCKLFNFDYYIEEKNSLGSYDKNCKIKPKFIIECLDKFKCPLIFLDVDAILTGNIPNELYNLNNYDIGITKATGNVQSQIEEYNYIKSIKNPYNHKSIYIRDGFLYVNYNNNGYNFLNFWNDACIKLKESDHNCLNGSVCYNINNIKIKILSDKINIANKNNSYPPEETFCYYRVSGGYIN